MERARDWIESLDRRYQVAAAVAIGLLLLCGVAAGLGALVSPRAAGEPLVLRPDLRAALEFERQETALYGRLANVRADVRYALDNRQPLLARSNRLESALQVVMDVHAAAERLDPPLAYRSRKLALLAAAEAHGDVVRLAAEWLNEPDEAHRRAVLEALCALEDAPECAALTPTPEPTPTSGPTPTPKP